jgi:hypothetical protein
MGVVFLRLNRTDARSHHCNIGVARRDPRTHRSSTELQAALRAVVALVVAPCRPPQMIALACYAIPGLEIRQLVLRRCATGSATM